MATWVGLAHLGVCLFFVAMAIWGLGPARALSERSELHPQGRVCPHPLGAAESLAVTGRMPVPTLGIAQAWVKRGRRNMGGLSVQCEVRVK